MSGPEEKARELIDADLAKAGWVVQHRSEMNLSAGRGIAVREFKLKSGHGFADYLLFVDQKAVGVVEAKPVGHEIREDLLLSVRWKVLGFLPGAVMLLGIGLALMRRAGEKRSREQAGGKRKHGDADDVADDDGPDDDGGGA